MKRLMTLNVKIIFEGSGKNSVEQQGNKALPNKYTSYEPKQIAEMVQQIPIDQCLNQKQQGKDKSIVLQKLLMKIKQQSSIQFSRSTIFFYLNKAKIYMKCGNYPLNENILIRFQYYKNCQYITILVKQRGISLLNQLIKAQPMEWKIEFQQDKKRKQHKQLQSKLNQNGKNKNQIKQKNNTILSEQIKPQKDDKLEDKSGRRNNQRRIGFVVDKVKQWIEQRKRPLNKHQTNKLKTKQIKKATNNNKSKNNFVSLQVAALNVGIPKKTLDNYLFHIEFGYKYKFNFNEHWMDKFSVLRNFVSYFKNQDKRKM